MLAFSKLVARSSRMTTQGLPHIPRAAFSVPFSDSGSSKKQDKDQEQESKSKNADSQDPQTGSWAQFVAGVKKSVEQDKEAMEALNSATASARSWSESLSKSFEGVKKTITSTTESLTQSGGEGKKEEDVHETKASPSNDNQTKKGTKAKKTPTVVVEEEPVVEEREFKVEKETDKPAADEWTIKDERVAEEGKKQGKDDAGKGKKEGKKDDAKAGSSGDSEKKEPDAFDEIRQWGAQVSSFVEGLKISERLSSLSAAARAGASKIAEGGSTIAKSSVAKSAAAAAAEAAESLAASPAEIRRREAEAARKAAEEAKKKEAAASADTAAENDIKDQGEEEKKEKKDEFVDPRAASGGVTVFQKEESTSEKMWRQVSEGVKTIPVVGSLWSTVEGMSASVNTSDSLLARGFRVIRERVSSTGESLQDRFFPVTEQAEAMGKVLAVDPDFRGDELLTDVTEMIPQVLMAFNAGDLDALKKFSSPSQYETFQAQVKARTAAGQIWESRLLNVKRVSWEGYRLSEGDPEVAVTFIAQQSVKVLDFHGKVLEGSDEDIRDMMFVWTLQRPDMVSDPTANSTLEDDESKNKKEEPMSEEEMKKWKVSGMFKVGETEVW